jgi:hypothetical protein
MPFGKYLVRDATYVVVPMRRFGKARLVKVQETTLDISKQNSLATSEIQSSE